MTDSRSPQDNPFTAPQAELSTPARRKTLRTTASVGQRLVNMLVDTCVVYALLFVIALGMGVLFAFAGSSERLEDDASLELLGTLLGLGVFLGYYTVLEGMFGRTLGKLVSGTEAVDARDQKISWGQAFGRSLARMIPLEALSALSSRGVMWHDSLAKTRVVRVSKRHASPSRP